MKRYTLAALALVLSCTMFTGCGRRNDRPAMTEPSTHATQPATHATIPATTPTVPKTTEPSTGASTEPNSTEPSARGRTDLPGMR